MIRTTLFLLLAAGCTKPNPVVCCVSPSDCSSLGINETSRPCEGNFVCLDHKCGLVDAGANNDGDMIDGPVSLGPDGGFKPMGITYIKASNTDANDAFGGSVAISADGSTLAIGASQEDGGGTGIALNQTDNSVMNAGAVYVFRRSGSSWIQEAYVKASNTGPDGFGRTLALSANGSTLAVGTPFEQSNAIGINGNQADNSADSSGAVYVFTRSGSTWSQQAYVKASNTQVGDVFGGSITLSDDGNTLAVGAVGEDSNATGIDGTQSDNSALYAGAVYLFNRVGVTWTQKAYVKASNTESNDNFGMSVRLSGDGYTLAVGAPYEKSGATGVGGNQGDKSISESGAVYVFKRSGSTWSQEAYVKATNPGYGDHFGADLALSTDGNTLAVGAPLERSIATGVGGDQADDSAPNAGAAYVYARSGAVWSSQAYVKASNTNQTDFFGTHVALSADGNALVVSATGESSADIGVDGNQTDNSAASAGAIYVLTRTNTNWTQAHYVKSSNTEASDYFGAALAISADSTTILTSAVGEDSAAKGVGGTQADNTASAAGAAYVYQ